MTCIVTALWGIYARRCYFTPRYINDDESHFVPRNPRKGLMRGAEGHAAQALIQYRIHKSEEGRGFQFGTPKWKQSRPSGAPHDWL